MMIPPDSKRSDSGGGLAGTPEAEKKTDREKVKGWPGYVRNGVFVIEKKINGKKYHRSTHSTTLRGAQKQLERFESNPNGFNAQGTGTVDALVMDQPMIDSFIAWHRPGVTPEWSADLRRALIDWANHLKGADLRNLSLVDDLKPHVATKRGKPRHVAAIKLLFKWLRAERGLITRAQDVTLDLITPTFKARQATGKSKAVPAEDLKRAMPHLPIHARDVLELLSVTGWHISEVRRFANAGRLRERDISDPETVIATIGTTHKVGGRKHFTALLWPDHVAAARRIRERGKIITNGNLRRHLKKACATGGVEVFHMGDMRASVATWLRLAGVPMSIVAEYLGHLSASTTRKYYVDNEVTATVLPRTAFHVVQGGKTA